MRWSRSLRIEEVAQLLPSECAWEFPFLGTSVTNSWLLFRLKQVDSFAPGAYSVLAMNLWI